MPEILESYDFTKTGRGNSYPWEEWSDGQTRRVERGVDFTCKVDSFMNALYGWTRRRGLLCHARRDGVSSVVFYVVQRQEEESK